MIALIHTQTLYTFFHFNCTCNRKATSNFLCFLLNTLKLTWTYRASLSISVSYKYTGPILSLSSDFRGVGKPSYIIKCNLCPNLWHICTVLPISDKTHLTEERALQWIQVAQSTPKTRCYKQRCGGVRTVRNRWHVLFWSSVLPRHFLFYFEKSLTFSSCFR